VETWIVTGGAGFIGSNFCRLALREADVRIIAYDKLTYAGRPETVADLDAEPRFSLVRGDITDRAAVERLLAATRPLAILNFAAETHVDRSIDGPRAFLETNVAGTFELLEASRRYWESGGPALRTGFRFLHVSTDEVFGSLGSDGSFSEESRYEPNSPYAASKAAADHWVRAYHHTFGLPTLLTNCSNNYGPYQFPEKLIPLMILNAVEGKPLPIYGDGRNVRDWLYVEDHCSGILRVLRAGCVGQSYNIGGRGERNNLEVVDAICEHLEELHPAAQNPNLRAAGVDSYAELKTFVQDRPGHDRRYAIDAAKVRSELGWEPRRSFAEGLRATVAWFLENQAWCKAVSHSRPRLGLGAGSR